MSDPATVINRLLLSAAVGLAALVVGVSGAAASSVGTTGKAHSKASPATVLHGPTWQGERTVTYCREGDTPLQMSLFAPNPVNHPVAAVMQVHGGGWQTGQRFVSLSQSLTATDLVQAGFVVASIDYRLAPLRQWPDQIIDVECAARYLHAHAAQLGIDPARIAAWGDSAGGQLVSLLGTDNHSLPWDKGPYPDASDHMAAIVDEFGPAQLGATDWPHYTSVMIRTVFGAWPNSTNPALISASPVTYVAPGDPPFLILQGMADRVVPESQSEIFAQHLRTAKVPVDLVLVAHGRHGLATTNEVPSAYDISSIITTYLTRTLH
ncbi:MAG TPA: alpha/beta hydrolase [Acidimicrobiales bacterium]